MYYPRLIFGCILLTVGIGMVLVGVSLYQAVEKAPISWTMGRGA